MKFHTLSDGTLYWMHRIFDGRWHVGAYHPYVEVRPERFATDITVASDLQEECFAEIASAPRRDPGGTVCPVPWFATDGISPPLPPVLHDVLIARHPAPSALRHAKPIVGIAHVNRNGLWVLSYPGDAVRPIAWTLLPSFNEG